MEALAYTAFAFIIVLLAVPCAIALAGRLGIGVDEIHGIQKAHSQPVPRLGGACIVIALLAALALESLMLGTWRYESVAVMICIAPLVGIGLFEDLTRAAGVLPRLLLAMACAALAWWLLDARIPYVHVPAFDTIFLAGGGLAFFCTIVAAAGVVHAFNMIDGVNGLASFVALVAFAALAGVAYMVSDAFVFRTAAIAAAATLGFLVWNYPTGRIFLGDTGSYLAGFLAAMLIILMVARNPEVSPWFGMTLVVYPVWEMFFSMWRRGVIQRRSLGDPDRLHLHQLVYQRLVRVQASDGRQNHLRHGLTALYFWFPVAAMGGLAVAFHDRTAILVVSCAAFATGYVLVYRRIARFASPRLFVVGNGYSARNATRAAEAASLSQAVTKTN